MFRCKYKLTNKLSFVIPDIFLFSLVALGFLSLYARNSVLSMGTFKQTRPNKSTLLFLTVVFCYHLVKQQINTFIGHSYTFTTSLKLIV